jgi:bifunctional pyridoxal-dependent enzyme with beta-cystathionase and maltose regulon repressor activities
MRQGTFDEVSLTELRRRRSYKWRAFPDDILPAFVAEMDFPLAPPVAAAIVDAVALGDAGYAWPIQELGEAVSDFLQARFEKLRFRPRTELSSAKAFLPEASARRMPCSIALFGKPFNGA